MLLIAQGSSEEVLRPIWTEPSAACLTFLHQMRHIRSWNV